MSVDVVSAASEVQELIHTAQVNVDSDLRLLLHRIERQLANEESDIGRKPKTPDDSDLQPYRTKAAKVLSRTPLKELFTMLSTYVQEREEAYAEMLRIGIKPLGVLPAVFLEKFFEMAEHYRFDHLNFSDNTIRASCDIGKLSFLKNLVQPVFSLLLGAMLTVLTSLMVHRISDLVVPAWAWILMILGFSLVSWYCCVRFVQTPLASLMLLLIPKRYLKRMLWSTGYDVPEDPDGINIELPAVPVSFVDKINRLKAYQLQPCIAADPKGFTFSKFELIQLFMRSNPWFTAFGFGFKKKDPILYVRHGSVVVVLEQYGPFLGEKEFMQLMRSRFSLF